MILFFDNTTRQPKDVGYNNAECVVVRNVHDAIQMCYSRRYDTISLDHDSGDDSAGTGYDFLNFLEEKAYAGELTFLPTLKIHSINPVGRTQMAQAITKIQELFEKRQAKNTLLTNPQTITPRTPRTPPLFTAR